MNRTITHQCILPATCFEDLPTFVCPFELSVSCLTFAAGPCKQSHLHRNWWSLPTTHSLKKHTTFCHRFARGAAKSKTRPCINCDEKPNFEELECKQATCHCRKEAVDAFPCHMFHVLSLLGFRKVCMKSSTVYRSRKLGSLQLKFTYTNIHMLCTYYIDSINI